MGILFPTSVSTILYRDPIIVKAPDMFSVPNSGSTYTVGWRSNDDSPTTRSLIFTSGSLNDGDITTIVTPSVTTNWSIGINTNTSGSYSSIQLYDSGTYPGFYFSGSNATLDVYAGLYPNSYVKYTTITTPERIQYSGSIYRTVLPLPTGCGGKYLKLHASDGPLKDPIGNVLRFTEMKVYEEIDAAPISGSYFDTYGSLPVNNNPTGTTTEITLKGVASTTGASF